MLSSVRNPDWVKSGLEVKISPLWKRVPEISTSPTILSFLPANESEVPILRPDKESSFAKTVSPPLIVSTSLADAPVVLILSGLNFLISVAIP